MLRTRRLTNTTPLIAALGVLVALSLWLTCSPASAICFAPPCAGGALVSPDFNGDGIVNLTDLATLASAFGSVVGGATWNPACDLNCDGAITLADLGIFSGFFNKPC